MKFSSKLLEEGVEALAALPGVGKKTALRLALHLVEQSEELSRRIGQSIITMRENIQSCKRCFNLSDTELCEICIDRSRKGNLMCLVESTRDVMAIEETDSFRGVYHVLGGIISPIDGIGPESLNLEHLVSRIDEEGIEEIIMAINPSIEGETTMFYISNLLKDKPVKISIIARGVSFGGELEYADGFTLSRSISGRIPYGQNSLD